MTDGPDPKVKEDQVRVVMPAYISRFFSPNEDAADRYQLKLWFSVSEIVFKLANWMTLIGLFKYIADKSSSRLAFAIYCLLNIVFLSVISSALNYVAFTPLKQTSDARRVANFFLSILLSVVIFLTLLIIVIKIVDAVSQIKTS